MRTSRTLTLATILVTGCGAGCGAGSSPADPGGDARPDGTASADAASVDADPGGAPTTEFAPYFYTWGWDSSSYAFSSLVDMKAKGGPAEVTIAFVLAGNGCDASTDIQDHLADVQAYVAAGGHVKASFGGADGTYLEYACATSDALAGALDRFVDATGVTDLDFDLEQGATSSNAALDSRRAAALAQVQHDRHVRVAFTLPVGPGGLEQDSLDILQAAVGAGVTISYVNGMTMDYGDGTDLGAVPIQSCDAVAAQLRTLVPGLGLADAYRMVGATAMIGKNDDDETFSIDDAHTLIAYARQKQLGLVSYWAIQRDQACAANGDLDRCSRANASRFQFSDAFASVNAPRAHFRP